MTLCREIILHLSQFDISKYLYVVIFIFRPLICKAKDAIKAEQIIIDL